uniref:Uncharacterized protein n=1 Tax=Myoviridae sp. ctx322 TaxID=2826711 RepID=A0A8S5NAV0_9CAUD|nr:MAG TPA: hypothetical protein [Myoviridae sp. ctx322]
MLHHLSYAHRAGHPNLTVCFHIPSPFKILMALIV